MRTVFGVIGIAAALGGIYLAVQNPKIVFPLFVGGVAAMVRSSRVPESPTNAGIHSSGPAQVNLTEAWNQREHWKQAVVSKDGKSQFVATDVSLDFGDYRLNNVLVRYRRDPKSHLLSDGGPSITYQDYFLMSWGGRRGFLSKKGALTFNSSIFFSGNGDLAFSLTCF